MTTPNLCQMAQETLQSLLADTGHVLTLGDFADLVELNEVAYRVMNPNDPRAFRLLMRPVEVAKTGIRLRPPTISRVCWINQYGLPLFGNDELGQYGALTLALSIEDPRELYEFDDDEIRERVADVVSNLDVVAAELVATMEQVMRFGSGDGEDDDPALIYGPIIAALVREYGGEPDTWLHDSTLETVESMLDDIQRRNEAENQQAASSAGSKYFAKAYLDSMGELRVVSERIRAKWEAA